MESGSEKGLLAAYVRVSTTEQAASGIGLDAQRHAIQEAARADGFEVASWHEDAGRSGASMRNRPGLAEVLDRIEASEVEGLVVAKIDRLGRSSADVLGLVERAQHERWRLLALDAGLDTATPAGESVATALAMAARFEFRRISERQLEKHDALRRAGRPRGRPTVPTRVADRIIRMRGRGASYREIGRKLDADEVPTARGAVSWSAASVRSAVITRERELAACGD